MDQVFGVASVAIWVLKPAGCTARCQTVGLLLKRDDKLERCYRLWPRKVSAASVYFR